MEHHDAPQHDEPCDARLDPLLDAALGPDGSTLAADDLVHRVLSATTPQAVERAKAEAWLDAALACEHPGDAPGDAPDDALVERILQETRPALYRRRHPVLAFIGSTPAYRAAAVVLLAVMLGIWLALASIVLSARDIVQVQAQVVRLDQATRQADVELPIDAQIASVERQLAQLEARDAWSSDDFAAAATEWPATPAAGSDPAMLF